jgi:hypothetical protein
MEGLARGPQQQGQSMIRYLIREGVGQVIDNDPLVSRLINVNLVHARADARNDLTAGQATNYRRAQIGRNDQDRIRLTAGAQDLVVGRTFDLDDPGAQRSQVAAFRIGHRQRTGIQPNNNRCFTHLVSRVLVISRRTPLSSAHAWLRCLRASSRPLGMGTSGPSWP